MHDELEVRLDALRKEMEAGQHRMQDLERQLSQLRDTMLRISGAIQVLEELQAQAAQPAATTEKADGENKLAETK
jgi:hypothetical protein